MSATAEDIARPKINELEKYTMFAQVNSTGGKSARLAWSIRASNPRITVYSNDPADTVNYGIISAPMNPETFLVFLDMLEKLALGEPGDKNKIDCQTSIRASDGTYGERTLLSEVVFGKDADGIIWMSVIAENRPKIKFEFKIYNYHKLYKADGSGFSDAEGSTLQTLAVIKALRHIYHDLTKEFRQNRGGTFTPNRGAPTVNKSVIDMEDVLF